MKKFNLEEKFLDERLMIKISVLSIIFGLISFILLAVTHNLELLLAFEKIIKITIIIFILWTFSNFHWDFTQGMMGALLFSLLYEEAFLVLGKLWGETSDFDAFLIMGVQGSLYLAAQSMSFLMTIIIILNHFVINYSRIGNYRNVIFNQISIVFKIALYVFLMIINRFLDLPLLIQINFGFEYLSDLCIIILIICIETQLNNFKTLKLELMNKKKGKAHNE